MNVQQTSIVFVFREVISKANISAENGELFVIKDGMNKAKPDDWYFDFGDGKGLRLISPETKKRIEEAFIKRPPHKSNIIKLPV